MSEKYMVITGASRGIGKAAAQLFVDSGFSVLNLSRSPSDLEGVINWSVDLADANALQALQSKLEQHLYGASQIVLVHNAGLLLKDSTQSISAEEWHRVLQVNVVAPGQLNAMLIPLMPESSSIVYIGSTLSEKAVANSCSYVTSKHAQLGLMRSSCQDLAGSGIHTACVCPGFTDTEMLRDHVGGSNEVLESIASGNAMNRLIEPAEIAESIYFTAQNPVMNGAVLHANLGQLES